MTPPPRLIYKWEQTTPDWHLNIVSDQVDIDGTEYKRTSDYSSAGPVVIARTGHLTPYDGTGPGAGDGRASVRVSEKVGPTEVPYTYTMDDPHLPAGGAGTFVVPTSGDEAKDELLSREHPRLLEPERHDARSLRSCRTRTWT